MLLDQLLQLQIQTNPWYHIVTFTIFGFIFTLYVKEITRSIIIFAILSIYAEVLQIFFPRVFGFEAMDIVWNFFGCLIGMSVCYAILAFSAYYIEPKKELVRGNDT